jgi:hypothetical protein
MRNVNNFTAEDAEDAENILGKNPARRASFFFSLPCDPIQEFEFLCVLRGKIALLVFALRHLSDPVHDLAT